MNENIRSKIEDIIMSIDEMTDDKSEKELWDKALDLIDVLIDSTPTKLDDFFIKPIIGILRRRFKIPD